MFVANWIDPRMLKQIMFLYVHDSRFCAIPCRISPVRLSKITVHDPDDHPPEAGT